MISVYSVLFSLVLFSELSSHVVTAAMPAPKEDGPIEQNDLGSILGDDPMAERVMVPPMYRRRLVLDANNRDEDGNPKIIIVSDMRQKGRSLRGMNPAFSQSHAVLADPSLNHAPEYSLKIDRRNTELDMLRCMIGRVYRPCWERENLV